MNLEVIKKFSEKREGGLKKLALDIGMSEQNLHRCIRNNKIQAADLEKIAILLKVDVGIFFDESVAAVADNGAVAVAGGATAHHITTNATNATNAGDAILQQKVASLEALLAEKERLITVLLDTRK